MNGEPQATVTTSSSPPNAARGPCPSCPTSAPSTP
jgi:hypothetical protein